MDITDQLLFAALATIILLSVVFYVADFASDHELSSGQELFAKFCIPALVWVVFVAICKYME